MMWRCEAANHRAAAAATAVEAWGDRNAVAVAIVTGEKRCTQHGVRAVCAWLRA